MKKSLVFIFFSILIILPLISAVQIDMKSNYAQDETLIAQVSGNFLNQIQQQNILLYNGHIRVSFIPYIQKVGDTFYIYGQLQDKSSGNYSIIIRGVNYVQSGSNTNADIVQNFTITNQTADFSVSPGFIESNNIFSINAQNLGDNSISVESFIENSTASVSSSGFFGNLFGNSNPSPQPTGSVNTTSIDSGQTKQISFSVTPSNESQIVYAVLETNNTFYEIPVSVPANLTQETIPPLLYFQPSQETFSIPLDSNVSSSIALFNSGQDNQTISISISNNLQPYVIIPSQIQLSGNSSVNIPVNITQSSVASTFEGQITAISPNSTAQFALILNFSGSDILPTNGTTIFETCSDLNGIFCNRYATMQRFDD